MSEELDEATIILMEQTPYEKLQNLGDFLCRVARDFSDHDRIIMAWNKKLQSHLAPYFYPEVVQTLLVQKLVAKRIRKLSMTVFANNLGLSIDTARALYSSDLIYLWEVIEKPRYRLLRLRNIGPHRIEEITRVVQEQGFEFDTVFSNAEKKKLPAHI